MKFTHPFISSPIRGAVDARNINRLSIDVGNLPMAEWEAWLSPIRDRLTAEKLDHIEVRARPRKTSRRALLLIEDRFYWIDVKLVATDKMKSYLERLKAFLHPILDWCAATCQGGYIMDERGMSFELIDDYMLFKLKFTGYGK